MTAADSPNAPEAVPPAPRQLRVRQGRRVRPRGLTLVLAGTSLLVLSVAAEQLSERMVFWLGTPVDGVVVQRHSAKKHGKSDFLVDYAVTVKGQRLVRTASVRKPQYDHAFPGNPVSAKVLILWPGLPSRLLDDTLPGLPPEASLLLAAAGLVALLELWRLAFVTPARRRRLVELGQIVEGSLVDAKMIFDSSPEKAHYLVRYRFRPTPLSARRGLGGGVTLEGSMDVGAQDFETLSARPGLLVCYAPDDPRQNCLYDGSPWEAVASRW